MGLLETDIFATKGIEYLLVIGYLILLPFFLWYLKPSGNVDRNGKEE